jgi:HEAT repeat protein
VTLGLALVGAAPLARAQPAEISNATVLTLRASRGLAQAVDELAQRAPSPGWVGWMVPPSLERQVCCHDSSGDRGCRLEKSESGTVLKGTARHEVALESPPALLILLRLEAGALDRVRFVSEGCPVDGGDTTLHWITDVDPVESVALLAGLVPDGELDRSSRRLAEGALAAVAHHAHPSADAALGSLLAPERPRRVREQAAFWMGSARPGSLPTLLRLARSDEAARFREHLAFVLTQVEGEAATDGLIAMARQDRSRRVRGQALFWLGQKAGRKAIAALEETLASDPDTEIEKRAVFALSQLPPDEGVPLLIRTARRHSSQAVRKQAFFWLGESRDPRALAFFEEVLTR